MSTRNRILFAASAASAAGFAAGFALTKAMWVLAVANVVMIVANTLNIWRLLRNETKGPTP